MANNTNQTVLLTGAELAKVEELSQTVLLICVKYGSDHETVRYLDSVQCLRGQRGLQVLVVDNAFDANPAGRSVPQNYTTIQAPTNLGYFGGARYGLSLYLEKHPLPDWVIVSNVDLVIPDPTFLVKLTELTGRPRLGAVAPRISSVLTGSDQNPFMTVRPSALRMHSYKWMFRRRLLLNTYEVVGTAFRRARTRLGRSLRVLSAVRHANRATIYAPHGSFLILSKNYFARGGDLQFPGFLFGEEIYIAESLKRMNLEAVYEPSLKVVHQEHGSTRLIRSRELAQALSFSAAYCADTFFPLK